MKITSLLFAALLLTVSTAFAQSAPKVGIVDMEQILQTYDKAQEADAELRQQQQRADAELRPMAEAINSLREDREGLIAQITSPSTTEERQRQARTQLQELETNLQRQAMEFQRLRNEANNTLMQRRNNMLTMMLDDIRGATAAVADNKGIDLVLNAQNEIVLFYGNTLDITDDVLAELK